MHMLHMHIHSSHVAGSLSDIYIDYPGHLSVRCTLYTLGTHFFLGPAATCSLLCGMAYSALALRELAYSAAARASSSARCSGESASGGSPLP